jgi:hypothetical protein
MLRGNKVTLVQMYSTPAIDTGPRETDSKIIFFLADLLAHTAKWLCPNTDQRCTIGRQPTPWSNLAVA